MDYVACGNIIWLWPDYLCKPRSKARDLQSCGVWAHYETLVAQAMSTLSRNSGSFHSLGLFPSRRQRSLKPVKRFINFAVVKKTQSGPREPSSSPQRRMRRRAKEGSGQAGSGQAGSGHDRHRFQHGAGALRSHQSGGQTGQKHGNDSCCFRCQHHCLSAARGRLRGCLSRVPQWGWSRVWFGVCR